MKFRRCNVALAAGLSTFLLCSQYAFADDLEEFLRAHGFFVSGEPAEAAALFDRLLNSPSANLRSELREPTRMLLAASLLANDDHVRAEQELRALLLLNPSIELNRQLVGPQLVALAEALRRNPEFRIELDQRQLEIQAEQQRTALRREEIRRTLEEAQERVNRERIIVRTGRWMPFVPFGVGQFANGNAGLGGLFLSTQIIGLGSALGSYALAEGLVPPDERGGTTQLAVGFQIVQVIGWSLFGVSLLGGVIEANVSYQPERVEIRPHRTPIDLRSLGVTANIPTHPNQPWNIGITFAF